MTEPLPPGWIEVIITSREFAADLCRYSPRVPQHDIFMIMFEERGIRITERFSLVVAPPFEMFNDHARNRVVVRQGPRPLPC